VRRVEGTGEGGGRWGSPRESVTGEAVLAVEERRCSNDGGGSDDRWWSARAPIASKKRGEGEAPGN
jgi:hypothetical protein